MSSVSHGRHLVSVPASRRGSPGRLSAAVGPEAGTVGANGGPLALAAPATVLYEDQTLPPTQEDANAFHSSKMPTSTSCRRQRQERVLLLRELRSHQVTKQELFRSDDRFCRVVAQVAGLQDLVHALRHDNARLRQENERDKATIQKLVTTELALRHLVGISMTVSKFALLTNIRHHGW